MDDPVHRSIVLRQSEEVGHPDKDHEQVAGESGKHLRRPDVIDRGADHGRCHQRKSAHVDRTDTGHDEHQYKDYQGDHFS